MAYSQDDITGIIALWQYDEQQADPRAPAEDIVSGLRKTDLVGCQYWIKGLSSRCSNWNDSTKQCVYEIPDKGPAPSGYGNGNCDYLGRQYACSQYSAGETEDLSRYWCIAPNMFLSGLGTASGTATSGYLLSPIPHDEIGGYCNGRCDEEGRGTGCGGIPGTSPVICQYYRPWQMGFGAVKPQQVEKTINDDGTITISAEAILAAQATAGDPLEKRLPFSFKLFNLRAYMQKCAYWDNDYGSTFSMTDIGVNLDATASVRCANTDPAAVPYKTLATQASLGIDDWLLKNVWSQAHTVICNGAKPECPCYTGKWDYCIDTKMVEGMGVTSNQIFEIRFYASPWGSQKEYEDVFAVRPNWHDVTTADVYTFDKWHKFTIPEESIMEGKRLTMCMPAPINRREFIPENFIDSVVIQYARMNIDIGTTAPVEGQIYFPTLIRDPDIDEMYVKPFEIIYPYSTVDPFGAVYCEGAVNDETFRCLKRGVVIDGDSVSVVGSSVRNKSIYVFNLNYFDYYLPEFDEHLSVATISEDRVAILNDNDTGLSPREAFFVNLELMIEDYQKVSPEYVFTGSSDSGGYFNIGPVPIKYQEINRILICIYYDDDQTWDFRIRKVLSKFYGGVLAQSAFTYLGSENVRETMPESFVAGATMAGNAFTFIDTAGGVSDSPAVVPPACNLESIKHTASNKYPTVLDTEVSDYTYCIKKITKTDEQVDNWGRIGINGLVWAEIEDLSLNDIFEWEVISAKMVWIEEEDEEDGEDATSSAPLCGGGATEVQMKEKEVEVWVTGQSSIPPSVCVLEPNDDKPRGFFNSDWTLFVTYWYKEISDNIVEADGEEVVWPDSVVLVDDQPQFNSTSMTFYNSGLALTVTDNSFTVEGVSDQTVALMGFFNDEEGRMVSCSASKMITQVADLQCRNVEIRYSYKAPATYCRLIPETSSSTLAVKIEPDLCVPKETPHAYEPWCGDHEVSGFSGKGPMWFPFNSCDRTDFYREYSGAAFCTKDYPDTPRDDMRFCGPVLYMAWVAPGGGSAFADCVLGFHYRYSIAVTGAAIIWSGYGNIVHYVDLVRYSAKGWSLPPFGNKGREMVEKWFSQERWTHLTYKNVTSPTVKRQWVPIVPDDEHFFASFNAFETASDPDLFSHMSQFNFMLSSQLVDEQIEMDAVGSDYKRYRFEEVFDVRGIWRATYPPPIIETGIQRVAHYCFQEEDMTWAWQELWRDIEYIGDREFYFVEYENPDYFYDYEKREHRYMCSEDEYTITVTAPLLTEGQLDRFPSIRLGTGQPRYFDIRYDSYDSTAVTWKDEGEGEVDGSGGIMDVGESDAGNIYEKTSSSLWSHDENLIFDSEAVDNTTAAEAANRKVPSLDSLTGELSYTYYNRGIIVDITRDKLQFLPHDELEIEVLLGPTIDLPRYSLPGDHNIRYVWEDVSPTLSYLFDFSEEERGGCVSKVIIEGRWGTYKVNRSEVSGAHTGEFYGCLPGVTITGKTISLASNVLYQKESVNYDRNVYSDFGLKKFTFEIPLSTTVSRMLTDQETEIQVTLDCVLGQYIFLDNISMVKSSYIDSTETIQVYERKYTVSRGSGFGDVNLNGPQRVLQYELEMDNSGSYYPISPSPNVSYVSADPVAARDKMRGIFADEQHTEFEAIEDLTVSTLDTVEDSVQKELYKSAARADIDGDVATFQVVCSPPLQQFFNKYGIPYSMLGTFASKCVKLEWEKHYLSKQRVSGTIWQPQGHKYQWDDRIERMRCFEYVMGSSAAVLKLYDVHEVRYLHMDYPGDAESVVDPYTALYYNRIQYQIEVAEKTIGALSGEVQGGLGGVAATFVEGSQDDNEFYG